MRIPVHMLILPLLLSDFGAAVRAQPATCLPDTTPRVTGIGGIFFGTANPAELRTWYGQHLGLAISEYGSPFEFRSASPPYETGYLMWSPFREGSDYFKPSEKEFIINYRVYDLEGLVKKLEAGGVVMLDSIAVYEYGKFVHLMDPDGNKIELWEPVDTVLTKIGSKTTK